MLYPGDKIYYLELLRYTKQLPTGPRLAIFRCDCGEEKEMYVSNVQSGKSRSCGCGKFLNAFKHGEGDSVEYRVWVGMRRRCNSPNDSAYKYYGAKGIEVCSRWGDFLNFLEDMGRKPEGCSLDRIDPKGDYKPSNCRWATAKQQANNKTNSVKVSFHGVTLTTAEWAEVLETSISRITSRIHLGWSPYDAVFTPKWKKPLGVTR